LGDLTNRGGGANERLDAKGLVAFDPRPTAPRPSTLSDADLKCLNEDEVVALQSLNTLRAAQHYMVELSEERLYVYAQAALTLFGRLTREVLKRPLASEIPQRILPVAG
jgi:hypothetical protein